MAKHIKGIFSYLNSDFLCNLRINEDCSKPERRSKFGSRIPFLVFIGRCILPEKMVAYNFQTLEITPFLCHANCGGTVLNSN